MIVLFYGANLLVAAMAYTVLFFFLRDTNLSEKGFSIVYFIQMLLIINTVSLKVFGEPYTIHLLDEILKHSRAWVACLFEFVDPLISFIITVLLMKRSRSYQTNKV